jgi:hypothetical protein
MTPLQKGIKKYEYLIAIQCNSKITDTGKVILSKSIQEALQEQAKEKRNIVLALLQNNALNKITDIEFKTKLIEEIDKWVNSQEEKNG